ncbi:hypothetical protein LTR57_008268 [Friedmanniomyces endolithicus]|nr:hypothetical protein LTR57_008268 [Friedmanniomyces endolithicus]
MGEAADLDRDLWPMSQPLGSHHSVTEVLPQFLALLKKYDVPATYFIESWNLSVYPKAVQRIAAAGIEIAWHAYRHEAWSKLDTTAEQDNFTRSFDAMSEFTGGAKGTIGPYRGFRPPGGIIHGDRTLKLCREHGLGYISPSAEQGAVVKLDGGADSIAVLPFKWRTVDAYYYMDAFAGLRKTKGELPEEAQGPDVLARKYIEEIDNVIETGGYLSTLFHPFLTNTPERLQAMEQVLRHLVQRRDEGDVHFWKTGGIGDSIIRSDLGLGHESAGIVVKTGRNVRRLKIGDRVALECGIPCSKPTCEACRTGGYNGCPDIIFYSSPPIHGTLRRYHVHPEAWLHVLPDSISYEEGALLEPLSVALAGIERSGLRLGDPLVICGAGPIGMVSLLAAHAAGAAPIVITDLDENRLAMAKRLVPRVRTIQIQRDAHAKANAELIKGALGCEAKLVIECTGVESSIHTGIYASCFGGSVFVIGVGKDFQRIPFMHASFREIDIRFQFRYKETYPKAIMLISEGLIDLKPLVTHRFALEQGREAFEAASDPSAKAVKVQLLDE